MGAAASRSTVRIDTGVAIYLACAVIFLAALTPALLAARTRLGFPAVSVVSGIPVAWYGIYFYTALAAVVAGGAAYARGAGLGPSTVLAVAGVGGYEFLYGTAYAITTARPGLLVPREGLPTSGWDGFGTWIVVEFLVASFGLICWDRFSVDRWVVASGVAFLLGLGAWAVALGWRYPPYDNSALVFLVNTFAEVSGALLVPVAFTSRGRPSVGFVPRVWRRIFRRGESARTAA